MSEAATTEARQPDAENKQRAEALRKQAEDIVAARKALDEAASMARGLWISFISLSAYLAVAVGSVTHRKLFLEEPLKLPILNVDLPLVAFFWIAPILFLILHAYLLLNLKFTGDNIREWERLVRGGLGAIPDLHERKAVDESIRLQLPNFLIVQMLAAPARNRSGLVGWTLKAAVIITMVIGPVLLLGLIQLQFLPYHDWKVTWVHRLAIIADMVLVAKFWPLVLRRLPLHGVPTRRIAAYGAMAVFAWFSIVIATFPGERMYRSSGLGIRMLSEFLFEGSTDTGTESIFSNRLILANQDFVDAADDALEKQEVSRSFRGRHLEKAILTRADLRKVDFSGASLNGADLSQATLRHAAFFCIVDRALDPDWGEEEQTGDLSHCADLTEANLSFVDARGASFDAAVMREANLEQASLQGASLGGAYLLDAILSRARLTGAWLNGANLTGASLLRTEFDLASLRDARLVGVTATQASFTGADLSGTDFSAATASQIRMNGANLESAEFQSAKFTKLSIRSANFSTDSLAGLVFRDIEFLNEPGTRVDFDGLAATAEKVVPTSSKRVERDRTDDRQKVIYRFMSWSPRDEAMARAQDYKSSAESWIATTSDPEFQAAMNELPLNLPKEVGDPGWLKPEWIAHGQRLLEIACDPTNGRKVVLRVGLRVFPPNTAVADLWPYRRSFGKAFLDPQSCEAISLANDLRRRMFMRSAAKIQDCELALPGLEPVPPIDNDKSCFLPAQN